jgi:hypothetical protein
VPTESVTGEEAPAYEITGADAAVVKESVLPFAVPAEFVA